MASLLPEFEQQFAAVTADITSKICHISSRESSERISLIQDVENLTEEARELLERMELEVRDLEPVQREKLAGRIKSYQVELKRLEGEYARVRAITTSEGSTRAELLEDGYAGVSVGEEQRQALLDNSETLERATVRLSQGHKIALETEHIGAQILNDLYSQRQTISHARERLRETDVDLDQSSRVLNTMLRQVLQNRFILYAVFIVVGVVIVFAIYLAVRRG
ncbi:vesicle transport through interaction with t-SNAREs homolog 1A [Procambarus clarkii]|uniref:vesicle transport through interaction with t-SNAREs homolog 1A n=1 Tax=Procambarus clarkii TaxID=6728 RepID=UPI003742E4B9